jgi:hypothetical protein
VPCSASQVVPGAHRVVGPGTHRCSGPREVHTTQCSMFFSTIPALKIKQRCTDGFGSDTHGYEFGCHYLPHFISNSDSHSNTYSIYNIDMDGNRQGRVRLKHLPARWHTRLSLLYPYPPNVTGKNPYPYPYPQGKRYPMGINIDMSLSSYLRVQ